MADQPDPAMLRVRTAFEKSKMTLDELGQKMGYDPSIARKSVWQFMKTNDPRLSMLRRFAKAVGVSIEELVGEKKRGQPG